MEQRKERVRPLTRLNGFTKIYQKMKEKKENEEFGVSDRIIPSPSRKRLRR